MPKVTPSSESPSERSSVEVGEEGNQCENGESDPSEPIDVDDDDEEEAAEVELRKPETIL
jgi:hypothetical protein